MKEGILSQLKYTLYAMFIYLQVEMELFKILMIFMIINTVSGVGKILRIDYRKFSFKILLWGFISKIGILIVPLLVALLLKALGMDEGKSLGIGVDMIVRVIIVSEFISAITNIYTIKTKKEIEDIDIFTMLIKNLRKAGLNFIEKYTKIKIRDDKQDNSEV